MPFPGIPEKVGFDLLHFGSLLRAGRQSRSRLEHASFPQIPSGAKAPTEGELGGTAKAVPFQGGVLVGTDLSRDLSKRSGMKQTLDF